MKILLVNYMDIADPGGINKNVREIAVNMVKRGHEVVVLQPNLKSLPETEILDGVRIIRLKSKIGEWFYGLAPEIYRWLRRNINKTIHPDLIHFHGSRTLLPSGALWYLKKIAKSDLPLILSPHFDLFAYESFAGKYFWPLYNEVIGKRIVGYADLIVAVSKFEANCLFRYLGVPSEKVVVIPHGVDILYLNHRRKKSENANLLYVGYLEEHKGVQYILRSLHELRYNIGVNTISLTIVGKGSYEGVLMDLANRLKVNDLVSWKGFINRDELIKEYRNADLFLLPSRSEAYGIVVAEALAVGTPCIVTKTTALTEFLTEPGCFGIDYPPDPRELTELIIRIRGSNVKVGPFTNKIRTWDKVTTDYEKVLKEILKKQNKRI